MAVYEKEFLEFDLDDQVTPSHDCYDQGTVERLDPEEVEQGPVVATTEPADLTSNLSWDS